MQRFNGAVPVKGRKSDRHGVHPHDHARFNGAVPVKGRKCGRGAGSPVRSGRFNGAVPVKGRKSAGGVAAQATRMELQWGRPCEGTEMLQFAQLRGQVAPASMGPSL